MMPLIDDGIGNGKMELIQNSEHYPVFIIEYSRIRSPVGE